MVSILLYIKSIQAQYSASGFDVGKAGRWNGRLESETDITEERWKIKECTFCHLWVMAKSQMGAVSLSDCKLFAYALHSKEIPPKP